MKKFILFLSVLLCFSVLKAQDETNKKFYVKAGGGYGRNLTPEYQGNMFYEENENYDFVSTYETKNFSFGNGMNFGTTFGMKFNKYIGVELGLSYLLGQELTITDRYAYHGDDDINKVIDKYKGKMFWIKPSIVLSPGYEKFNPYMTIGFVYGIGKIINNYEEHYFNYNGGAGDTFKGTFKYKEGYALGFSSSIGASLSLSKYFALYGELNMINAGYTPSKGEITELYLNGADYLSMIDSKEVNFVKKYNDKDDDKGLKQTYTFDSFGINIGIKFNF